MRPLRETPESAALKVLGGYSIIGLLMAVALGSMSFMFHGGTAGRAVCSTGAMAGLLGAAAGLNLRDRIHRRKYAPLMIFGVILIVIAVCLVGVSALALENDMPGAWSPLIGAGFLGVLAVICMRLSSQVRNSKLFKTKEAKEAKETNDKS